MQRSAIAFMLRKFVAGVLRVHFHHDAVASDFGDDARGGDAEAARVAADQGGVFDREWAHGQAVDERVIRLVC